MYISSKGQGESWYFSKAKWSLTIAKYFFLGGDLDHWEEQAVIFFQETGIHWIPLKRSLSCGFSKKWFQYNLPQTFLCTSSYISLQKYQTSKQILSFHKKLGLFIVDYRILGLESTQILDGNVVVGLATTFPPRKVIPHRSDSLLSFAELPWRQSFPTGHHWNT